MRANPDIKGFFAANDQMALGIGQAVKNAGKTGEIAIIGVDGIEDALKAISAGDISATVSQYPYTIGQLGVEACVAAAKGNEAAGQRRGAGAGRHQGQRRQGHGELPGARRGVRQPVHGPDRGLT